MARVFLRFPKFLQHPACKDHAILHGKPVKQRKTSETTENVSKSNEEMSNSHNNRQLATNQKPCSTTKNLITIYKIKMVRQWQYFTC